VEETSTLSALVPWYPGAYVVHWSWHPGTQAPGHFVTCSPVPTASAPMGTRGSMSM